MKTKYFALAALAAIAASCSNDDENIMVNPDRTPDTPISLTANVAGLNATRTITDEGKLVDATLGLFVTTQNVNNSKYTATNMLWTGDALGNWTSAATVLYEGANSTQSAYAYAPHSADYDATAGTVAIDLATQTDYLYAAPTALTGSSLALNMVHRLSKLTVDITGRGTEVAANDKVAAISLANLPTTATWALADNTLTLATTTGTVATGATDYTALVLPGTESFSVIVTMESGRIFKSAVTAPTGGLASGTAYTVSLKVGKDKVTMGEVSVTDWAEENIPGGEAEEVKDPTKLTTSTVASESLSGEGTEDSPYLIQSAADLLYLSQQTDLSSTYRLTTDIEVASDVTWTPISYFRGTFDGNGKTISGTLATSGSFYGGVFGALYGTVKNLNVSATITASNSGELHVGGIVGYLQPTGIVEGCTFSGTITKMVGNTGKITCVGGIAGSGEGTIKNCINTGTVNGPDARFVFDDEAMSAFYVTSYVGGIAGRVRFAQGIVYGCTHSGSVVRGNDCDNATANSKLYTGSIAGGNYSNGTVCSCNTATTDTDMAKVGGGSISETCSHTTAE